MALDSGKYFYFNAPILKQPTQPLIDAHIHYPTTTLRHPHGAMVLLVFINEQGELEKASTLCANPAFEDSARASIQGMKFVPARDATGPVKSFMIVEYSYGSGAPCGPLPPTLLLVDARSATMPRADPKTGPARAVSFARQLVQVGGQIAPPPR